MGPRVRAAPARTATVLLSRPLSQPPLVEWGLWRVQSYLRCLSSVGEDPVFSPEVQEVLGPWNGSPLFEEAAALCGVDTKKKGRTVLDRLHINLRREELAHRHF